MPPSFNTAGEPSKRLIGPRIGQFIDFFTVLATGSQGARPNADASHILIEIQLAPVDIEPVVSPKISPAGPTSSATTKTPPTTPRCCTIE